MLTDRPATNILLTRVAAARGSGSVDSGGSERGSGSGRRSFLMKTGGSGSGRGSDVIIAAGRAAIIIAV